MLRVMTASKSAEITSNPPARLQSIAVTGLFGSIDIDLNLCADDITLLFGTNGSGKSTLLRIIDRILTNDLAPLLEEPFSNASLSFADGSVVGFDRNTKQWTEKAPGEKPKSGPIQIRYEGDDWTGFIEDQTPYIIVNDQVTTPDGGPVSPVMLEHVKRKYFSFIFVESKSDQMSDSRDAFLMARGNQKATKHFRKLTRKSRLITSNRLQNIYRARQGMGRLRGTEPSEKPHRITSLAEGLKAIISEAREKARKTSADTDSTSFQRMLEDIQSGFTPGGPGINNTDARSELEQKLNELNERLIRCALSTSELKLPKVASHSWPPIEVNVLFKHHLQDLMTKAKVSEEILNRLETLINIVNSRLVGKRAELSADAGLVVKREDDDANIPLTRLSSGEQHLSVLFYSLIFQTTPGGVCLIDEPEISLNVDWQESFISDLQLAARISPQQFIIATHSPQIASNHRNLLRTVETRKHNVR